MIGAVFSLSAPFTQTLRVLCASVFPIPVSNPLTPIKVASPPILLANRPLPAATFGFLDGGKRRIPE